MRACVSVNISLFVIFGNRINKIKIMNEAEASYIFKKRRNNSKNAKNDGIT